MFWGGGYAVYEKLYSSWIGYGVDYAVEVEVEVYTNIYTRHIINQPTHTQSNQPRCTLPAVRPDAHTSPTTDHHYQYQYRSRTRADSGHTTNYLGGNNAVSLPVSTHAYYTH